jgi:hypothetical protein
MIVWFFVSNWPKDFGENFYSGSTLILQCFSKNWFGFKIRVRVGSVEGGNSAFKGSFDGFDCLFVVDLASMSEPVSVS